MNGPKGCTNGPIYFVTKWISMADSKINYNALMHHLVWPIGIGVFSAALLTDADFFPSWGELEAKIARSLFAWGILLGVTDMVTRLLGRQIPLLLRLSIAVVIAAVPISFFVPWVTVALGLVPGKVMFVSVHPSDILADFPGLYVFVLQITFLTWIAGNYQRYQRLERDVKAVSEGADSQNEVPISAPVTPASASPAFLDKVARKIGMEILALKSEQHYLRVYTVLGDDLILYRLSDAIAELEAWGEMGEGLQAHRSYWVAKSAVADITRDGKLATITLTNGLEIPVSRNRVKSLKMAGWI